MDEKNLPSYFSILPAQVRYDPDLTPLTKILFSEITALANKEGYCFALNEYFAILYGVSERWVTKALSKLKEKQYIQIVEGFGYKRKIYIEQKFQVGRTKVLGTPNKSSRKVEQKFYHNNSTLITKHNIKEKTNIKEKKIKKSVSVMEENILCKRNIPNCSWCSLSPCTDLDIWTIAKELDIPISDVREKHKQIIELIESGYFQKKYKYHKTVYFTLRKWLRMDMSTGRIQNMSEMQRMDMPHEHPDEKARVKAILNQARKEGRWE